MFNSSPSLKGRGILENIVKMVKIGMNKIIIFIYSTLSLLFISYLLLPSFGFPNKAVEFLQSQEPADVETPLRRGYFTDFDRQEAISHYRSEMARGYFGLQMPTVRLNYPPEESGTIIRDQTRSTYLEEIVVPFRESLFISGFEPKVEKDAIIVENKLWGQKLTVKLIASPLWARLLTGIGIITAIPLITFAWLKFLSDFKKTQVKDIARFFK